MKFFITILLLNSFLLGNAQIKDPASFQYKAVKKSASTYEIIIKATVPKPWHIYSQNTPSGGPIPTTITFKKNPLVTLNGKVKETGKLMTTEDKNFGVAVKFYADEVLFTQLVTVKANVKTNVAGTIEYMLCDDGQCLPPTKKSFDIKLQ